MKLRQMGRQKFGDAKSRRSNRDVPVVPYIGDVTQCELLQSRSEKVFGLSPSYVGWVATCYSNGETSPLRSPPMRLPCI
jgi:hypothetical protein